MITAITIVIWYSCSRRGVSRRRVCTKCYYIIYYYYCVRAVAADRTRTSGREREQKSCSAGSGTSCCVNSETDDEIVAGGAIFPEYASYGRRRHTTGLGTFEFPHFPSVLKCQIFSACQRSSHARRAVGTNPVQIFAVLSAVCPSSCSAANILRDVCRRADGRTTTVLSIHEWRSAQEWRVDNLILMCS